MLTWKPNSWHHTVVLACRSYTVDTVLQPDKTKPKLAGKNLLNCLSYLCETPSAAHPHPEYRMSHSPSTSLLDRRYAWPSPIRNNTHGRRRFGWYRAPPTVLFELVTDLMSLDMGEGKGIKEVLESSFYQVGDSNGVFVCARRNLTCPRA